ncbi:MAG: hypothetical protein GX817_03785 [Elusimicrobia bacterium]|nr:hypothetical protein [Elusimicrobiota bacterium]
MITSDYKILVIGSDGFILPYSLIGIEGKVLLNMSQAREFVLGKDLENTLFILDEEIIDDVSAVEELEEAGANITILKAWGSSELADRKIRAASIKAIGTEIS